MKCFTFVSIRLKTWIAKEGMSNGYQAMKLNVAKAESLPSTSGMYDSWKNLYPPFNVTLTGRLLLVIFLIKAFLNNSISTRLWCQNSEEIEVLINSAIFVLILMVSHSCEKKFDPWWTVIKANDLVQWQSKIREFKN